MANTDAFKNAIARKQILEKELQEINNFLALYQKFSDISLRRGRPPRTEALGNYIANILANGQSMHTKEILERINADNQGDLISADDKLHSISVVLSRDPRFTSNRERGWTLKIDNTE